MEREVAYLVNAEPVYLEMVKTSIHLLRQHNENIAVTAFLVHDGRHRWPADFADFCDHWCVQLCPCPNVGANYFQDNKIHLARCQGERVLLLDADTFVFADVAELFEAYRAFDVVACTNDWVWHRRYRKDFIPGKPLPMNSGVVLCSSRFLRSWTASIPGLHETLCNGRQFPALTRWLYEVSRTAYNREEFGLTICSAAPGFYPGHFAEQDCKVLKFRRLVADLADFRACTKIFHSLSPQWRRCVSSL
jgi:hypothetical protein